METKKNIKVKDFVNNYKELNSDELKAKMMKSLLYRKYVPIMEKKVILQNMFNKSLLGDDGNKYVDMFINRIGVTISVISMYTNLTFNRDEDSENNIFDDYDLLAGNDLLNLIFGMIPKSEVDSVLEINSQIIDTFYNQYKSTEAFVTSLVDRFAKTFGLTVESSSKALLEVLNDEEKMKNILNNLPKNSLSSTIKGMFK